VRVEKEKIFFIEKRISTVTYYTLQEGDELTRKMAD